MKSKKIITSLIVASMIFSGATIISHANYNTSINKTSINKTNNILLSKPENIYDYCIVNNNANLILTNKNNVIIDIISTGEMASVLQKGTNKSLVKIKETGAIGYINNNNLQYIESNLNSKLTPDLNIGQTVNISNCVNLRSGASMSSNIVKTLTNNQSVKILAKQGEWFKVSVDDVTGFIYEDYIGILDKTPNSQVDANSNTNKILANTTTKSSHVNKTSSSINVIPPHTKVDKIVTDNTKTNSNTKVIPTNKIPDSKVPDSKIPDKTPIKPPVTPKYKEYVMPQNQPLTHWETGYNIVTNMMNATLANGVKMNIYSNENTLSGSIAQVLVEFNNEPGKVYHGNAECLVNYSGAPNKDGFFYEVPLYYHDKLKGTLFYAGNTFGMIQNGGYETANSNTPSYFRFSDGYTKF